MTACEFAGRLHGRPSGRAWEAPCPAHNDHKLSVRIRSEDDGRVLLRCHAGC